MQTHLDFYVDVAATGPTREQPTDSRERTMIPNPDAYPEQILAAAQDHIRVLERRQRQLETRRAEQHVGPWSWIRIFNRLRRS